MSHPRRSPAELFARGSSFRICAELHVWPPLATMNAFLQCEVDDVEPDGELRWSAFELGDVDYDAAVRAVDPRGVIDALGVPSGDWRAWFLVAVGR